jgi:predicted transcriptional regulator of viral defense system
MLGKTNPISIARQLHEQEQFYFSPATLSSWLAVDRATAYRLIARMRSAGLVLEVERGKYLLLGLQPEHVLSNPLFIANHLVTPSYISYWSALHFHGFTTQVPREVFCATTKKKRPVIFHGQTFRYVTLQPRKFFGYRRETLGDLPVLIADEAKAVVDSLDQSRYAGGILEVGQALYRALPELDVKLLIEYAVRMEDKTLASRLGFWLEMFGQRVDGLPASPGPVALDPTRPRTGTTDARWKVIINLPIPASFTEGVG